MSLGNDGANGGPMDQYGQSGDYQPYDPVTGLPLPPGPPAYSAVYPYAPQQYPTQQYPTQQYPTQQYPTQQNTPQQYPTQQYPPQQYAPGQYVSQAYPPQSYGQQPGHQGYPPAGYQLVPMYPLVPTAPPKPGGAVAAAVLAFVQAGLVLIGSVFMFTGASVTSDIDNHRYNSEFTVVAIILLIVGGLLIAGGTTLLGRRTTLLAVGGLLSIALSVYFIVRLADFAFGIAVWVPIVYAVLPVLAIALSMGSDVRSWVRSSPQAR